MITNKLILIIIVGLIANIFNEQIVLAVSDDSDSAKVVFEKQIRSAFGDKRVEAYAYYQYGIFLDENNNSKDAIFHLKKALQLASSVSDDSLIARTANYLGGIYWVEGDCPSSTQYFETALKRAESCKNKALIAIIKMNLR